MVGSLREGPCVWNDDEDMVMRRRWRSDHETMVKESDYFPRAAE
jgi:DNA/RNA-binding domain of Phe-tRNA-synthetase-like protein